MASYGNAVGRLLYTSGATKNHYSATNAGLTMTGTAQNDTFWGDSRVRTTMSGGAGDDIYYLYSSLNKVSEGLSAGIDTISTWMDYTLPDNIENLTVTGAGRHAFGNTLDNIINGAAGTQTINGGKGDDVLFGGSGADIFVMEAGNGSDLLRDFSRDDVIRLDGYGFTSFAAVRGAMTQVGTAVKLALGNGEVAVFSNTTVASFSKAQFEIGLDLDAMTLTFSDEFNTLSIDTGASGTWEPNYWWGAANGNSLHGNGEDQWYVDTRHAPTSAVNPFSVADGVLTITADRAAPEIQPLINGFDFTSGMLTTHGSFAQTYGYFEIRADMPEDKGVWPAFWLLPADGSWPPELDVIEMVGQEPTRLILSAHSNETGVRSTDRTVAHVTDTSGFHDYGMLWGPEEIVWYFDGVEIASAATPADMHKPMYMIANLAVGGVAGDVAADFDGSQMKIDHIRAYDYDGDWPVG